MKIIPTSATANGHYSHAIASGNLLFISGQLPVSADKKHNFDAEFKTQVQVIFKNLDRILQESGCTKENLVKVTVYITDINLWDEFNGLYAEYLGNHKPVRCVVPVPELHFGYKLEVEAIAELTII